MSYEESVNYNDILKSETVASRGYLQHRNCLQNNFRRRFASTGGVYSAPPDPLAGGERAGCPLSKNPTPASFFGPFSIRLQPFGALQPDGTLPSFVTD